MLSWPTWAAQLEISVHGRFKLWALGVGDFFRAVVD